MGIIVSKSGKNAKRLSPTGVSSEEKLQQYIYDNPDCIPLNEYKDDIQFVILDREFRTDSGPIDALAVDQDGELYLIETKLYKNPDKRQVLAQVLDYGASLWNMFRDPEEFIDRLQEAVSVNFNMSLREKIVESFADTVSDPDEYLEELKSRVAKGTFRFVVLMDQIQDRLKHLITYMNQNSSFDVFGVELEFYQYEEYDILIPKLFGAEVRKSVGSRSGSGIRRNWDEESFFEDAKKRLQPEELALVREVYEWARQKGARIDWGSGAQRGSFNPKFEQISRKSILTVYSDGDLVLNFGWLARNDDTQVFARKLVGSLRKDLKSLDLPSGEIRDHATIPLKAWSEHWPVLARILERLIFQD